MMHNKLFSFFAVFLIVFAYVPHVHGQTEEKKEGGIFEMLIDKATSFVLGKGNITDGLTAEEVAALDRARIAQVSFAANEQKKIIAEFENIARNLDEEINLRVVEINNLRAQQESAKTDYEKRSLNEKISEAERKKSSAENEKSRYVHEQYYKSSQLGSGFALLRTYMEKAEAEQRIVELDSELSKNINAILATKSLLEQIEPVLKNYEGFENKKLELENQIASLQSELNQLQPDDKNKKNLEDQISSAKNKLEEVNTDLNKKKDLEFEKNHLNDRLEEQERIKEETLKEKEKQSGERSRLAFQKSVEELKIEFTSLESMIFSTGQTSEGYRADIDDINKMLIVLYQDEKLNANEIKQLDAEKAELEALMASAEEHIKAQRALQASIQRQINWENFKAKFVAGGPLGWTSGILQIFGMVLEGYKQYEGIAKFGSLFIGDEELHKRRAEIHQEFCGTILGGAQCIIQETCAGYIETPPSRGLVATTVSVGEPKVVAHIEGEKSFPTKFVNETDRKKITEWTYKITYYIFLSKGERQLSYNIEFAGDELSEMFFPEDKQISSGGGEGRLLDNPVIKTSNKDYNKVCLVINPPVISATGRKVNRLCNLIQEYAGPAVKIYEERKEQKIPSKYLPPKEKANETAFNASISR